MNTFSHFYFRSQHCNEIFKLFQIIQNCDFSKFELFSARPRLHLVCGDGRPQEVDERVAGHPQSRSKILPRCPGRRAEHFPVARTSRSRGISLQQG